MGFRVNTAGAVKQNHFAKVPSQLAAPRSAFDRSFSHKTTFDAGYLIPVMWEPILPGDTINLKMNMLCRLATPIFPYMDNVYLDVHYFFVPNRLLWTHWENFQGAQANPTDTTDYEVPSLDDGTHSAGFSEGSIYDYFGLPTKIASVTQADMPIALPLRAYNKIWNDWYRDENLQNSLTLDTSDGPDTTTYALQLRNRRKDYFTSALPWPQKGDSVQLPLQGNAPVLGIGKQNQTWGGSSGTVYESNGASTTYTNSAYIDDASPNDVFLVKRKASTNYPDIYADMSDVLATSINTLRESIVLQQMLELDARGGTRYVEILLSRFGVVSPDFRLQRSEYLGGQTLDVNVSPIAQSSASNGTDTPQGNLSGFAVARGRAFVTHSFVEHGQLLALASIRADTTYQDGLNRHWSVRSRYDYYEPLAANLGEQSILNKEIFLETATPNTVWGYQERWAEYRYKPSYVTGKFRSNATGSLDAWHLAIDLGSVPTLANLIPEAPDVDRIIAVPTEPQFILDSWTNFRHVRVMPIYSTPGLMRL